MLKLDILRTASAMATHATQRQSVIAKNIANADTPGYRAMDLERPRLQATSSFRMRSSNPKHLDFDTGPAEHLPTKTTPFATSSPNGNNVSLENQMLITSEIQHQHELAIGVYKKSLTILRTTLGRRG